MRSAGRWWAALAGVVLAGCWGARPYPTDAERDGSLAAVQSRTVDGLPLATWAVLRAALVHRSTDDPGETRSGLGTAAVVTSDGYCVTAAHVVHGAESVYARPAWPRAWEDESCALRVVWDGSVQEDEVDLAVVHAEGLSAVPPRGAFDVRRASVSDVGATVLVVGHQPQAGSTRPMLVAGRITEVGDDGSLRLTAPCRPGDSGGPVVDVDGRLIGVITTSHFHLGRWVGSHARSVDPAWLRGIIDADRRRR